MTTKPNVQMAASVEFLGVDLKAGFEHTEAGDQTRDVLVARQMNVGADAKPMAVSTLAQTIADNLAALGGANPPEIQWPQGVEDIVKNYQAYVNSVFLKVEKVGSTTDVEYALWVGIKLDEAALTELKKKPPFNLVAIKDLYLKIWNTDTPAILEAMNFVSLDQLTQAAPRLGGPKGA